MHPENECVCGPSDMAHSPTCPHFGSPKWVPTGSKTVWEFKTLPMVVNLAFFMAALFFFFGAIAFLAAIFWMFNHS